MCITFMLVILNLHLLKLLFITTREVKLVVNALHLWIDTRVGIVATIYLQLIQNRYMFRSFTVLHCSHQHCLQPVASDVGDVGYLWQRLLC